MINADPKHWFTFLSYEDYSDYRMRMLGMWMPRMTMPRMTVKRKMRIRKIRLDNFNDRFVMNENENADDEF